MEGMLAEKMNGRDLEVVCAHGTLAHVENLCAVKIHAIIY
jgi:hypothetical protein